VILRIGHVPYLNMVPFHQGFGPGPMEIDGRTLEFHSMSPRAMGLEAEKGLVDAGALSLVDWLKCSTHYEPIGRFGIGVKRPAGSVLLFSRVPLAYLEGMCAVTDETSTSFRLLQILLEKRYNRTTITFGRIASSMLFDGSAESVLLIGDEALRAKAEGVKGLPLVTDLGEEWFRWHNLPFVFARWVIRTGIRQEVKDRIEDALETSLLSTQTNIESLALSESFKRQFPAPVIKSYWNGFAYRLTPEHERSIRLFQELIALYV